MPKRKKGNRPEFFEAMLSSIANNFPNLRADLLMANMQTSPKDFVLKSFYSSLLLAVVIGAMVYVLLSSVGISPIMLLPLAPLILVSMFLYTMKLPEVRMLNRRKEIDMDIVFAGRQMLIELRAGVPLFDSILGVTKGYGQVSVEFSKIVEKSSAGISIDVAMRQVAEANPSKAFGRIMSQLASSVRSGSDITSSLDGVLEQVSKEQEIELKAYGQKLNPLAMFYMIVGVILPSLGVVLVIIVLSFVSVRVGTDILLSALLVQALLQYIFLTMVESARPRLYA